MRLPTATYRLQFRDGMDFDRAAALVPYLDGLGVSHLYASPLFAATPGSAHGYDVTDPGAIEPALGGRAGLERLSAALKARGMGLVVDIVPNHMAFAPETPWLRDVLRHGTASFYARHFDLDMEAERLRLPWLPDHFEALLDEMRVADDPDGPVLAVGDLHVPLADGPGIEAARAEPTPGALRRLHDAQPWRLVHWRTEQDALTHRRFFNVTGLVGLRVEDPEVFEDVHALLFDLVAADIVQGVRIDHVDGLADPAGYLARLRARLPRTPLWVEKILSAGEDLPAWPIEGTTGYEVARTLGRLLTDAEGRARIGAAYSAATGRDAPIAAVFARAKRQILTEDLAAELWSLHALLREIAAADPVGVEFGPEALRHALVELVAAFPRYRTYMTDREVPEADAALLRETAAVAAAANRDPGAIPFLARVLVAPEGASLRLRFQQVTGAVIAKAQEDTAFYREVPLLSANEVGGEPDDRPLTPAEVHEEMAARAAGWPAALTLTSSHDTKRSEDARMRIAAIAHAPEPFLDFEAMVADEVSDLVGPNLRWYLAQTVLAMAGEADLGDRLATHVEKALREAKSTTFWSAPNPAVEEAAEEAARRLAARFAEPPGLLDPILDRARRLILVQAALKLTLPGIPDIYQGTEAAAFALTDPDNRRAVDFDRLAAALEDPAALPGALDREKFALTRRLLRLRREDPALFAGYQALPAPEGVFAFERKGLQVAVSLGGADPDPLPGRTVWPEDTGTGGPVQIAIA